MPDETTSNEIVQAVLEATEEIAEYAPVYINININCTGFTVRQTGRPKDPPPPPGTP